MNKRLLIAVLLMLCHLEGYGQQNVFKNGDQVCFVGNSITMQGGFHHDIALFYATRFPTDKIHIFNCGISGNQAAHVIARMDNDILIHKPDWSVIKLGMNDVRRDFYSKDSANVSGIEKKKQWALDLYRKNYEIIIKTLLKHGSKIILQTPTIYEESTAMPGQIFPGRNGALKTCAGYIEEFGKKYNLPVVDYWYAMQRIDQQIQTADPSATIIGKDREHPGDVGHLIMAYQFLKTTQVQPIVAELEIVLDKTGAKASGVNSTITNIKSKPGSVSFTALENSLPFPVTEQQQPALKRVPFIHDLNREILRVKQLKAGKYLLRIDGEEIGAFAADSIEKGINLALYANTPQYVQAQKVLASFKESWGLEGDVRWAKAYEFGRLNSRKGYSVADAGKYFDTQLQNMADTTTIAYKNLRTERDRYMPVAAKQTQMLARMDELHDQIYKLNKPVAHRFEITEEHQ